MMKPLHLLTCALVFGCGDSATNGTDAGPAGSDAAVAGMDAAAAMDAAAMPAGDHYELDANRTVPNVVECRSAGGYVISGRNTNRTGFTFYFQGVPAPGTYGIVVPDLTQVPRDNFPRTATAAVAIYSADPAGGPEAQYIANGGTVTVSMSGGKLKGSATALPATDVKSNLGSGAIGAELTCP